MSIIFRNFRQWWQEPRRAADRIEHRQVTFLELFYDLVYVALVAQLSHTLASDLSWAGLGRFAFLFVIVFWAWLNGTTYADTHGNNDVRTRVFTFAQMFTVVAMAIFAHGAMGETAVGFALSYAAFQLILGYLWSRSGYYDPDHRPLSTPYTIGFAINTLLFIGSVFVDAPLRFYLWGIALVISLMLPVVMYNMGRFNPSAQDQIDRLLRVTPSLVERFGLLTIIVLGEVVVGVVNGVTTHHDLTVAVGGAAALGTLTAIALWWIYFDAVSHRIPRETTPAVNAWFGLHLPLTMAITAVGAAVLNIVEHAGEPLEPAVKWLLVGAVAVVLISIRLLTLTIQTPEAHQRIYRIIRLAIILTAIPVLLLPLIPLSPLAFLGVLDGLLLLPILFGLLAWVEMVDHSPESREMH